MTTNQLTWLQLQESERANRAQEALKGEGLEVERQFKQSQMDQIDAQIERLQAMLPYELKLTDAQVDEVRQRAEKEYAETLKTLREQGALSAQDAALKEGVRLNSEAYVPLTKREQDDYAMDSVWAAMKDVGILDGGKGKSLMDTISGGLGGMLKFFG